MSFVIDYKNLIHKSILRKNGVFINNAVRSIMLGTALLYNIFFSFSRLIVNKGYCVERVLSAESISVTSTSTILFLRETVTVILSPTVCS